MEETTTLTPSCPISETDLWAEADAAATIHLSTTHKSEDALGSDDEDEWGNNILLQTANSAKSTMIRLEDGDIHLCDASCPYAIMRKDGDLVCPFSSMVISHVAAERTDYSTGRSTWSADPDMQGGNAGGGVVWKKKIDKVQASKQAHVLSKQINDSIMPAAKMQQRVKTGQVKRGALCVDEKVDPNLPPKRARMSKKHIESNEQVHNMVSEAASIFTKLLSSKKTPDLLPNKKPCNDSTNSKLTDANFLFDTALRKYIKESSESGKTPLMDDIHNISLTVQAIVEKEKRKQKDCKAISVSKFKTIHFREVVSRLAVSLWRGACHTPYMGKTRRGGDSFRPFCVGVFYSLKRGLTLSDGTVLVPAFSSFQHVFPTAKDISSNQTTKTLHASSHRGLCSIHRCIASIDIQRQHVVFAPALRLVTELVSIE